MIWLHCRRQTSEEREAERQAASRYLINLQAEVLQNATGTAAASVVNTKTDPLIFNNAALNAMQSLQPWSKNDNGEVVSVEHIKLKAGDSTPPQLSDNDDDDADDNDDDDDGNERYLQ